MEQKPQKARGLRRSRNIFRGWITQEQRQRLTGMAVLIH
jgi:hypothetical protein